MKDHLGSVRTIFKNDSWEEWDPTLVSQIAYDPYGNPEFLNGNESEGDMLYTGHFYHRPSGLYLAPYRAYDPKIGRWLSREPLGLDGPNLYHYGFNDPVNTIDPDGLDVIYLHDRDAIVGGAKVGHPAVLIGNDKDGWKYFSWAANGCTNTSDNLTEKSYPTLIDAKKDSELDRYDEYLRYPTTPGQDLSIGNRLREKSNMSYNLGTNNCQHFASTAVIFAGNPWYSGMTPNTGFDKNKPGKNDKSREHGKW